MPVKANKSGIWRTIWGLLGEGTSTPNTNPDISDDIQQVASYGFGWDDPTQIWRELGADSNGRQRVTFGPNQTLAFQYHSPSIAGETLVLDVNKNRQYVYGYQFTPGDFQIGFRAGDIAAGNYIIWPAGVDFWLDGYIGQLYLASPSGATSSYVLVEW